MDLEAARDAQRLLEIGVMKMIRDYEEATGCVITKAVMEPFEDTRFFMTQVFLGRKLKKQKD